MTNAFLPNYGLFLLSRGVHPGTRLVFFDLPIDHFTGPALRMVSVTLSIEEEPGQNYAISFDFIGPRIDELLAVFPEQAREALWQWLEDRATVGEHLLKVNYFRTSLFLIFRSTFNNSRIFCALNRHHPFLRDGVSLLNR